ncbi:MAG: hypothetical protein IPN03_20565 [Holophagales bacterium]|nr:hypothetical protein [Holophagales bacterium]
MSRIALRLLVAASLASLLSASALLAQPTPTPTPGPAAGPGPWSADHPIWFDMNGDHAPQASELMGYPQQETTDCTRVVGLPSGIPGTGTETPCMFVYEDTGIAGSRTRQDGMTQSLVSNADGTLFTFTQEPYGNRTATSGGRALAAPASGTGQLLDQNFDGIFDAMRVEGTGVPETRISLLPQDATGDGRPDYITVPWTTSGAGLLGVSTTTTPQIYFPLTDTNDDDWPDTITVQVAGVGGISTTTGPPLSGAALANGVQVPSASTFGLFVFGAAVVALGVKLLRGTIVAS